MCGGSRCARLAFVGARTVKPRHRNTDQAEIDRKLSTMMDKMVKHHPSNASHAWHGEDLFAAGEQLPPFHHLCVAYVGKCGASLGRVLVELDQQALAVFNFRWLVSWAAHRRVIELVGVEGRWQPAHHGRDVAREPSNSSGFLVGLPVPLFIGTSFEDLARVLHLLVKLSQHHLSNGHGFLPCGIRDSCGTDTRRTKSELSRTFFTTRTPFFGRSTSVLLRCVKGGIG